MSTYTAVVLLQKVMGIYFIFLRVHLRFNLSVLWTLWSKCHLVMSISPPGTQCRPVLGKPRHPVVCFIGAHQRHIGRWDGELDSPDLQHVPGQIEQTTDVQRGTAGI